MIDITLKWMEEVIKKFNITGRVLDVGSKDVNGCPRQLFTDYIGIDMSPGKNVDMVVNAYDLKDVFEKESFDVVLCLSVLEHVSDMNAVLDNINYLLKKGGYFFVSVPSIGFPLHEWPSDYWRFTEAAVREHVMKGYDILSIKVKRTTHNKFWIIDCVGVKK